MKRSVLFQNLSLQCELQQTRSTRSSKATHRPDGHWIRLAHRRPQYWLVPCRLRKQLKARHAAEVAEAAFFWAAGVKIDGVATVTSHSVRLPASSMGAMASPPRPEKKYILPWRVHEAEPTLADGKSPEHCSCRTASLFSIPIQPVSDCSTFSFWWA
ncbi:hypothetical protein KC326_g98 [Hortaea werneckii]|nr:hypothetical protein KC326_g98 [Hortaea werneckii]